MIEMTLSFVSRGDTLTLNRTRICHPLLPREMVTVRGTNALSRSGTFRWSAGVRALALLLVRQALTLSETCEGRSTDAVPVSLEGEDYSLAASLDYALSKHPLWVLDMFGMSNNGSAISKLLFRRVNPDRKRGGPVVVFLANRDFAVRVEVDGRVIEGSARLRRIVACLEAQERTLTQPHIAKQRP